MNVIIGRCSLCQGDVSMPLTWSGTVPPVPTCQSCGAVKDRRPVIEMIKLKKESTCLKETEN